MYLSFQNYQEIMQENGYTKPELSLATFFDYVGFALKHDFTYYGIETGLSLGVLYYRYAQITR